MPPRLVPIKMLGATKKKLDEWEKEGIIVPISYNDHITFVSALNPVEKEHGKEANETLDADDIRITVDCRNVNKAIINERITLLPDQQQIEYDLNNAQLFSMIDVRNAFSTLSLSKDATTLFTFSTPWGLYRLVRFVQGVSISSEAYQSFIIEKFKDIQFVKCCIDDFLIYGKPDSDSH